MFGACQYSSISESKGFTQSLFSSVRFMGQLTLARWRGDTTFGLVSRILATTFGCAVGLAMWYVVHRNSPFSQWLSPSIDVSIPRSITYYLVPGIFPPAVEKGTRTVLLSSQLSVSPSSIMLGYIGQAHQ